MLNADYRPLSYYPLSLWPWQDAIKAAWLDRVQIVAEYDAFVHSPSMRIRIPSVVVLKDYVKPVRRRPDFATLPSGWESIDECFPELGERPSPLDGIRR